MKFTGELAPPPYENKGQFAGSGKGGRELAGGVGDNKHLALFKENLNCHY